MKLILEIATAILLLCCASMVVALTGDAFGFVIDVGESILGGIVGLFLAWLLIGKRKEDTP